MNKFEELRQTASDMDIDVVDYSFTSDRIKGLYCDGTIAIKKNLTETEKKCVLAEEIGHHETAVGDIIEQSSASNRKQEMRGRILAYNRLVGLRGIIDAYNHHCGGISEAAEHLGVTEEFLTDALDYYKTKYGVYTIVDNYAIIFEPAIAVLELI